MVGCHVEVVRGGDRRDLLHDWVGFKIVEWDIRELIPVGWAITDFDAGDAKVAVETLTIAHTGFLNDQLSADVNKRSEWKKW